MCCISGCCGECECEGKNGKFCECAGACPARRIEWEFVRGGEVLRETREEVVKSGEVLRESRLVFFEWSGGGEEKQFVLLNFVCFSVSCFRCLFLTFLFLHDLALF